MPQTYNPEAPHQQVFSRNVDASGDSAPAGTAADPLYQASAVTYTSSSIASATGASQVLAAASDGRRALTIINPITGSDWTIDPLGGTAAVGTMPGFVLRPGDSWSPYPVPLNAISGIGTAASKLVVLVG
jgi:hypothetical protein